MHRYTGDTYIYKVARRVGFLGSGGFAEVDTSVEWQEGFPVALSPIAASILRDGFHLIARVVVPLTATVLDSGGSAKLRYLPNLHAISAIISYLAR